MPKPIFDKLNELKEQSFLSFHMPGHKRKKKYIPFDLLDFDFTEIEGLDNLHNPKGIIKESQEYCAKLFGADFSFYLVNGSTSGIQAAITALCCPGDKILVSRNCHKSVYNGIILSGASPVYVLPDSTFFGTFGAVSVENIEIALKKNNDIKAAVITSPTYEGLCSDIKSIAELLHKKNIPLIVDEAHGAHFKFSDKFPKTALSLGADISVQSLHKTLPVLTQTSILHVKSNIVNKDRISSAISLFTSTSPSYIFMAIADNCQNMLSENAETLFNKYTDNLENFYNNTSNLINIKVLSKSDIKRTSAFDNDFGKIICLISDKNIFYVEKSLKKYYNINIEMKGFNYILLMTSFCDEKEDFIQLENALKKIDRSLSPMINNTENILSKIKPPVCAMSPSRAFYSKSKKILFEESKGFVSAEFLIPYPPGIPILVPGEIITSEIIDIIKKYKKSGIEISGCKDKEINFINVII